MILIQETSPQIDIYFWGLYRLRLDCCEDYKYTLKYLGSSGRIIVFIISVQALGRNSQNFLHKIHKIFHNFGPYNLEIIMT